MHRLRNVWTGRTLARDVPCIKCDKTIMAGTKGYKRRTQQDLPDWTCEVCVP